MRCVIEIELDNAAFEDGDTGMELKGILTKLAKGLAQSVDSLELKVED